MKKLTSFLSIAALLVSAHSSAGSSRTIAEEFAMQDGDWIELQNVNGSVSVSAWGSDYVSVTAIQKASSDSLLDKIDIKMTKVDGGLAITTDIPKSGFFGWGGSAAEVSYEVKVPRRISLRDISSANGNVDVSGVLEDVHVSTANGNVEVTGAGGNVHLKTANGRITVRIASADEGDVIRLATMNGSIELYLDDEIKGSVDASTTNGSIRNDFGIQVSRGRFVGSELQGRIGEGGGPQIHLETKNGSIRILEG